MFSRAAIYVRQSINHPEGIDRGIERCRRLIEARGWHLIRVYQDNNVSASKSREAGTGWAAMLDALDAGEFEVVVGVDLDRLLRSTRDLNTLIDHGARVLTVDGEIDLTTADGEFRATMLAGIARFEVRRKGERQRRANDHRVNTGLPVAGGRRRFGFEADHMTVRESEANWIRFMYQRVADGASMASVCRALNEAGVPCVTKGLWNPPRIAKILVNPAYVGNVIHYKQAYPSDKVPVIVDPELADRVRAILANPARRKSPGPGRRALLGGLARCSTCEAALVSAGTKSRGKLVNTYACGAVKQGQTGAAGHPAIRRHILDEAVANEVANAFMFGRNVIASLPEAGDPASLDMQAADLNKKKVELLALVGADTGVTTADVRPQLVEIARQVADLESRRSVLTTKNAHARMLAEMQHSFFAAGEVSITDAVALKVQLRAAFDALPLDMQRLLVSTLLDVQVGQAQSTDGTRGAGKGLKRVSIVHKIVTSLNEEGAA